MISPRIKNEANKVICLLRQFFSSEWSMLVEFMLAALLFIFEVEVAGVCVMVYIIAIKLLVCEDTMPALTPFLMTGLIVLRLYDSFNTFFALRFVIGVPAILGIVGHFIIYRKRLHKGGLTCGYIALSIALLLGGLFSIGPKDYFRGTSLYYMLGLGVGMLLVYSLMLSHINPQRNYDVKQYVSKSAIYAGALAVMIVLTQYMMNYEMIHDGARFSLECLSSLGNNLSTSVLLLMPFAFYLSKRSPSKISGGIYYCFGLLEAAAAIMTLSRGGIIFVSAEVVALIVIAFIKEDKKRRIRDAIILLVFAAIWGMLVGLNLDIFKGLFGSGIVPSSFKTKMLLVAVSFCSMLAILYVYYVFNLQDKSAKRSHIIFISTLAVLFVVVFITSWSNIKDYLIRIDVYRGGMMKIAVKNFKLFPFFGTGIGYTGLRDVYANKTGMFGCYHCLPVQVVGSMGLFGVVAYIYMLRARMLTLAHSSDREFSSVILLSYIGIILMSLVNPGIFCPVVYGVQLAIYFVIAEQK